MEPAKTKPISKEVAYCRHCYDHLAGEIGVRLADALVYQGILKRGEVEFSVTAKGEKWFESIGIDVEKERLKKRQFARQCLDWTERKHHLAGTMGASLFQYFIASGWLKSKQNSRAMIVTDLGKKMFESELGIEVCQS